MSDTDLSPELEELIAMVRSVTRIDGPLTSITTRDRLTDALDAYDESIKPQPIDGYLIWDDDTSDWRSFAVQDGMTDPVIWDHVLKGTFVPSERIK